MTNKISFDKFDLESYVEQYASKDTYASRTGEAWFKCCFHDEKTASLKVFNKQVFKCHGCGAGGGVLDFITQYHKITKNDALKIVGDYSGQEVVTIDVEVEKRPFNAPQAFDALYSYNNGYVLKYRLPKGSKAPYVWANFEDGQWWVGTGNHDVGLYAPNGLLGTVVLAEGEKDADALCAMGFNGASSPNGTYKWKESYTESLKQADKVILLNDNDEMGIAGVMLCNRDLILGNIIAKRVLPQTLHPSDKVGYDIYDVVENIGAEETRKRLQEQIDSPERWNRFIYSDEEILAGVSHEEVIEVSENVKAEVEIVYQSELGEEYDALVQKAVKEILLHGIQDESTSIAIAQYAKENKPLTVGQINRRIKVLVDENKETKKYVVRDSPKMLIEELGREVDISGSGYYVDSYDGSIRNDDEVEVIGHFLGFVGVVVDAEMSQDKNVKVALAYNTPQSKKMNVLIVEKRKLSSTNEIVSLLSGYNINVTSANAMVVVKYLQDLQNHFKENTITMKSLSRFGWFDNYLMPFEQKEAQIVFDATVAQPVADKLLETVGDKQLSLQLMNEIINHSESNAVIAGTAVASLIMSYMDDGGVQPFALNVYAATSTGKSVSCQAVSSLFGYPFKDNGWWGKGSATLNNDQYHNALLGNLPNFIDDPALNRNYDPFQKREYIYKVTSGQSRGRMDSTGQNEQDIKTWCNTVIMTNETQFIDDSIHEGGARARCLEVQFDKPLDTPTVERWIEIMGNNYGHFAIDLATTIRKIGKDALMKRMKEYIRYFNTNDIDGKRTINASYVMMGLDILKESLGLQSLDPREWLIKQIRGSGELSPGKRAYEKLMARIEVSENVYREQYDRDEIFVGSFGYAGDGKTRVVNLAVRTLQRYGKEDNYNYAELIHWAFANRKMVARYDEYDKPIGTRISDGQNSIAVFQVYYEWTGVQHDRSRGGVYEVDKDIIEVRMEDEFNG